MVKEEKLLLLAQESNDPKEQVEAVAQVVRNCTNNVVDPRVVPYFDTEYLIVQLRARSVGEQINPTYRCNATLPSQEGDGDTPTSCDHKTTVPINLFDVTVTFPDSLPEKTIELSPQFTLYLRYPTISTIDGLLTAVNSKPLQHDVLAQHLTDMFHLLEDKVNNITYTFDDYSLEEKAAFLYNLRSESYQKLIEFATTLPTVTYTTTYTCKRCEFNHTIRLSGLTDFLG